MSNELSTEQQQALRELTRVVTEELAKGKDKKVLIRQLVKQNWPEEAATNFVNSAAQALEDYKKSPVGLAALAEKNRKRMLRGLAWTVAGIVITAITYTSASAQGGTYLICWGAILFGIIDFLIGLFGWLRYK